MVLAGPVPVYQRVAPEGGARHAPRGGLAGGGAGTSSELRPRD